MKSISLNGVWKCTGEDESGKALGFDVTVPGTVHSGMMENGLAENMFYGKNADKYMWIEKKEWSFERDFDFEKSENVKKTELEFGGLDTYCTVYLNGEKLGVCDNMNIAYTFDVLTALKDGKNTLRIDFLPPTEQVKDVEYGICSGAFATDRMFTRRMQCTYGWDWVHRLVTMGIWKDVTLFVNRYVKIDSLNAQLVNLTDFGANMEINIFAKHDYSFFHGAFSENFPHFEASPMVRFEVKAPDGKIIYDTKRLIREELTVEYFTVENPKLWYPNGYGDSPLYSLQAEITDENGELICEKTVNFGIRSVSVTERLDKKGSETYNLAKEKYAEFIKEEPTENDYCSFEPTVNGIKIFCRGANWVPADPFPGNVPYERIEELIRLAHDSGINMLRIWGGGYFESEEFYDLCDRYGIMLQQDFLMACGTYPYDDALLDEHNPDSLHFTQSFKTECEQNIARIVSHPSIMWYNGDNENMMGGSENFINNARRIAYGITLPAIRKYDRTRRFFASSPWGGTRFNSPSKGMFHATGFLDFYLRYIKNDDMDDYVNYFGNAVSRFANETPIMSSVSVCSLKRFMPKEELGIDKFEYFDYHTKNHPSDEYKDFHLFDHIDRGAKKIFGEFKSAEDRLLKMNLLGYEWTRSVMESYRRNIEFTSGNLFWMYNDCWPAIGWSMVDFFGVPKTAYYAMKRNAADCSASVIKENGKIKVYVSNVGTADKKLSGRLYFVNSEKIEKSFEFDCTAKTWSANAVFECEYEECTAVVCDILGEGVSDRAFLLNKKPASLNLKKADITIKKNENDIELTSACLALFVTLDGEYVFSDNAFLMLPGEHKSITLRKSAAAQNDEIKVMSL